MRDDMPSQEMGLRANQLRNSKSITNTMASKCLGLVRFYYSARKAVLMWNMPFIGYNNSSI